MNFPKNNIVLPGKATDATKTTVEDMSSGARWKGVGECAPKICGYRRLGWDIRVETCSFSHFLTLYDANRETHQRLVIYCSDMKITNLVTLLLLLYYSKPCTAFGHLARSFAKLARPNGPSLVSLTACLLSLPDALIWMLRNFSTFGFNGCNLCWMMKEKNKVLADAKCCFFLGWKLNFQKHVSSTPKKISKLILFFSEQS